MDGLNQSTDSTYLNIKVTHGIDQLEVAVPSNSTFGDLKSIVVQKAGQKPEMCKLLFRGKEKDDDEFLQASGVKDNSKVLLMEDSSYGENVAEEVEKTSFPEEIKETTVISQGEAEVTGVRREVDDLADQVAALQAVVDSGTKVDNKDIIYLTEMLMRVLLRLDCILADGEGRIQRKMEVIRVQALVDTMDVLKTKNSIPLSNGSNDVTVTTEWETFETGSEGSNTMSIVLTPTPSPTAASPSPSPAPSSGPTSSPVPSSTPTPMPISSSDHTHTPASSPSTSTKVTQEWENFD